MSSKRKPKKKRGPAPKFGRRPTLTIRVQEPLYLQIKDAAADVGRSISEEIESRLQRQSDNLLNVIVRNTFGAEPKYVPPANGREVGFAPSAKAMMKERLAAFIDSLPDAEESSLSKEEADELSEMVQRHRAIVNAPGKAKP